MLYNKVSQTGNIMNDLKIAKFKNGLTLIVTTNWMDGLIVNEVLNIYKTCSKLKGGNFNRLEHVKEIEFNYLLIVRL